MKKYIPMNLCHHYSWKIPSAQNILYFINCNLCILSYLNGNILTWNIQNGEIRRILSEHKKRVDALLPIPNFIFFSIWFIRYYYTFMG